MSLPVLVFDSTSASRLFVEMAKHFFCFFFDALVKTVFIIICFMVCWQWESKDCVLTFSFSSENKTNQEFAFEDSLSVWLRYHWVHQCLIVFYTRDAKMNDALLGKCVFYCHNIIILVWCKCQWMQQLFILFCFWILELQKINAVCV